jgi:polar amino acid transport system permease protein
MSVIWEYRELFISGTLVTIKVTLISSVFMVIFALVAGLSRLSRFWAVRSFAICYVEFFRGTSLIVQLFWFYFALPMLGISLPAMTTAVLGLSLCLGAYGAEVVRACIQAIAKGQVEAAIALNFSRRQRMRFVILPQALRAMLPPFSNLLIELLKGTSLIALITIPDLTFQAKIVTLRTMETLQAFGVVLVVYFIISQGLNACTRIVERKVSRGIPKIR